MKPFHLRSLFSLILVFAFSYSAAAQAPREVLAKGVSGRVIDDESGQPLGYATVSVFNAADSSLVDGAITGPEGKFKIELPLGEYYLKAQFVSYLPKEIAFSLTKDNPSVKIGEILLAPNAETLDEVYVRAEKSTMEFKLDRRVFNVGKDLANTGANAQDVLRNVPSVEVDVDGNVSLRGSGGVRILVNGKPSGMMSADDPQALRMLQGSMIERIEVITNPSARYEAQGEAGIINIVLKEEDQKGVNGSFDLSAGFPHNYNAAYNLNYRRSWLNLFSSYGVNYRSNPGGGSLTHRTFQDDSLQPGDPGYEELEYYEQDREHVRSEIGNTFRLGADVYFNDKNVLTATGLFQYGEGLNRTDLERRDYSRIDDAVMSELVRDLDETEYEVNYEFKVDFRREYEQKDKKWETTVQWIREDDIEVGDIVETSIGELTREVRDEKYRNTENEETFLFQSDFVQPIWGEGRFETGVRANIRRIGNDFLAQREDENGNLEAVEGFDNDFTYLENIYAAYVIIGNDHGKFSWQTGLRSEYTDISTEVASPDAPTERNPRDYLNFFPSAFVSYEVSETDKLQASYSRRLNRPRFRQLLLNSNFSDPNNLRQGNPDLDPEFTDAYEIGYLKDWASGSFLASAYYRHRTGVIERVTTVDSLERSVSTTVNLSTQNAYGLEGSLQLDITDKWRLNGNFDFYRAVTEGSYEGQDFYADAHAWNTRWTNIVTLFDGLDMQASINYRSPRITTQGRSYSITVVDLGASKEVLDGKGTLSLSVRDLFNSRRWAGVTEGDDFRRDSEFQWRARTVTVSFNYRLNQDKPRRGGKGGGRPGGGR